MKFVLRHKTTGRYFRSPGQWVRRADNALSFDAAASAHQYQRVNHIPETQAVLRLAPYLIPLLNSSRSTAWEAWLHKRAQQWQGASASRFRQN
jgi:hypothetical protein